MNINIINWMERTRHLLPSNLGEILEVGSLNVNGSAREVYKTRGFNTYMGIDIRGGKDVNVVMNAHLLPKPFGPNSFDTVICVSTLEHDDKFWLTLEGINRALKKGGSFVFCVPTFHFPKHDYPEDYWRMSEEAVRKIVMNGYEVLNLEEVPTKKVEGELVNFVICAIGRKL